MTPKVLEQGLPWDWAASRHIWMRSTRASASTWRATSEHSALRRFVMGDVASKRAGDGRRACRHQQLVREAMHAGAAGFSSSLAPTHVDQSTSGALGAMRSPTIATLIQTHRRGWRREHLVSARDGRRGLDERDRARPSSWRGAPACRSSCRASRSGRQPRTVGRVGRLPRRRAPQGAAILWVLRTQPSMRPFNWQRDTSPYHGSPLAQSLRASTGRAAGQDAHAQSASSRAGAWTIPTPTAARERRAAAAAAHGVVDVSQSDPSAVGKAARSWPTSAMSTPPTSCASWRSRTAWRRSPRGTPEPGVGGGQAPRRAQPAHDDRHGRRRRPRRRDDGSEWSTYSPRLAAGPPGELDRRGHPPHHRSAGDGRGIKNRGLIARGVHANYALHTDVHPSRQEDAGQRHARGERRWQVRPEGIARVLVNGETIVEMVS